MNIAPRLLLLVLASVMLASSEPQYGGYFDYPGQYLFRGGSSSYNSNPYSSFGIDYQRQDPQARFFFTTFTLTLTTTTST